MSQRIQNIAVVAFSTVGSRVLGLLRDILLFALLGAGVVNSAFIIAFTLPNLFRRLLGEGALTSAFVPVLSGIWEESGSRAGFQLVNQVLTRLIVVITALIGLGSMILLIVPLWDGLQERWYLGARLGLILLPYMIFVCIAAILGAILNVLNRFALAALSPVWLNLCMILSLGGFGYVMGDTSLERVGYLCGGVLVGGLVQVIIPALALLKEGWKVRPDPRNSPALTEVGQLLLPGLAGAAIFQINIVVSRLLAFHLSEDAVSILYLANRLIELPLGIFAIAVTTVLFPNLSRLAARQDEAGFSRSFAQGMRLITAVTVPAAIGLVLLGRPIVHLLFNWGLFGAQEVNNTLPVLAVFAVGLPIYAWAAFYTRIFHSLKDTQTPLHLSKYTFLVNLVLSLSLMFPLGIVGLALAGVLSMTGQTVAMRILLARKVEQLKDVRSHASTRAIVIASVFMGILCFFGNQFRHSLVGHEKTGSVLVVVCLIPLAASSYFFILFKTGFKDREEILSLIKMPLPRFMAGRKKTTSVN